jgi:hypothetical protein
MWSGTENDARPGPYSFQTSPQQNKKIGTRFSAINPLKSSIKVLWTPIFFSVVFLLRLQE